MEEYEVLDTAEEVENIASTFSEDDLEEKHEEKPKKKINKKKIIIFAVIIGVIIALFASCSVMKAVKNKNAVKDMYTDTAVEIRTISNTITGSSYIVPNDSYNVMTIKSGDITADYFKEGDTVKKGDKLYQFDDADAQKSLKSSQNALTKAEQSLSDAQKTVNNLSVKSNASGKVKEVLVERGDSVQSGSKIATVYNDSTMKIQIPFNEADAQHIYAGESAVLTVAGTGNELTGRVTSVGGASVATGGHSTVRYVNISVTNPGALTASDKATAQIGEFACADAGQFEYISEMAISAEASGKIERVNIKANDTVYNGQIVATLDSDSAQNTLKTARLGVDDAKISLERAKDSVKDYLIEAPIEGTVVTKNAKSGDTIDSSNGSEALCVIYDLSCVKLSIDVDETEIALVTIGQDVKVTADAVEGEFLGKVIKVPVDGVNQNGVTTYTVEIQIDDYGDLLPGMNVDAEITVDEAHDVLTVPVNSVNRGNIVFVKDDGEKRENDVTNLMKNNEAGEKPKENKPSDNEKTKKADELNVSQIPKNIEVPEGYVAILVETGINDAEYIEIKSGLNEGDMVRTLNTKSSSADATFGSGMPMMSGMGGGMPSGGMGGGMSSGGGMSRPSGSGGGMPGGMR